jgi:hypothetical protein|tara:strand:- start:964 stop:1176 length:213 start_codon:yes stop_codon:yes gene_type:complete
MSFTAGKVNIGKDIVKEPESSDSKIELTEKELEFLLVTIKNSLFKGEYVETLYNLTLKLQKHFVNLKSKK